ncbi:MAG: CCA tRNA nucleotidyltransferase [Nitrospirae bacterium]|nr:CCA tRNA nucleotidyltransferase [Nitrospirota bacterium]
MLEISLNGWFEDMPPGQLYLVGGTVRDLFLNSSPKDIDLVCKDAKHIAHSIARQKNAALVALEKKPEEPCYRIVDIKNREKLLDIAEMRGESIYEDLGRRDFTVNAIAIEIRNDCSLGRIIDPLKGEKDIKDRIIRRVSDKSLESDPLRILRAVRFAATLDFEIEPVTLEEMKMKSPLIRNASSERLMAELMLILRCREATVFFRQMDELGLIDTILPESIPMKGCRQNGYHHKDVWEHSLLVMENAEHIMNDLSGFFGEAGSEVALNLGSDRLSLLKMAALFHDVGKPITSGLNDKAGRITFYGHEKAGAGIIEDMAVRLKMSCQARDFLRLMVAEHLRPLFLASHKSGAAARMRWFRKMKDDAIPAIILSMADIMSSLGPDSGEDFRVRHISWAREIILEYYRGIKTRIETPILVSGNDLLGLGMESGPGIGRILAGIRSAQDVGDISTHSEAIELAKKLIGELTEE